MESENDVNDENDASKLLILLQQWQKVESSDTLNYKDTIDACKQILSPVPKAAAATAVSAVSNESTSMMWDAVMSLPWDSALDVKDNLHDLLSTVLEAYNTVQNTYGVKVLYLPRERQGDIPITFPASVPVIEFRDINERPLFDVIVTDTTLTKESDLLPLMKDKLSRHGSLIWYNKTDSDESPLTTHGKTSIKNAEYTFYYVKEYRAMFIKIDNWLPFLTELSMMCTQIMDIGKEELKNVDVPHLLKWKRPQFKSSEMELKKRYIDMEREDQFHFASFIWRLKLKLLITYEFVYDVVVTYLAGNIINGLVTIVKILAPLLVKLGVLLFKCYMYAFQFQIMFPFQAFKWFLFITLKMFTRNMWLASLLLGPKKNDMSYLNMVKRFLRSYKENQVQFYVILSFIIPVAVVSYNSTDFIGQLAVEFQYMAVNLVTNVANSISELKIYFPEYVRNVCGYLIPLSVVTEFLQQYLLNPGLKMLTYLITPIGQSKGYTCIVSILAFLGWMRVQYNDILLGPSRLYISNNFYFITKSMTVARYENRVKPLYLNNYFSNEQDCENACTKVRTWPTIQVISNNEFVKGGNFDFLLDAVNNFCELFGRDQIAEPTNNDFVQCRTLQQNLEKLEKALPLHQIKTFLLSKEKEIKENETLLLESIKTGDTLQKQQNVQASSILDADVQVFKAKEEELNLLKSEYKKYLRTLHDMKVHYQAISDLLKSELVVIGAGNRVLCPLTIPSNLDPNRSPLYFYYNDDYTFSPLMNLNVVCE
jgi:hypothetical protein